MFFFVNLRFFSNFFNFSKLKSNRNYSFRLANKDQLNLALLNADDKIIELTMLNEKGSFTYDKLTYMVARFDPIEAVDPFDATMVDYKTVSVYGQVFRKLPGDMTEGTKVSIYDDEGNLVGYAKTDAQGKFAYHQLKPEHTYVLKVDGEDGNYQILTLDEFGNVLSTVVKNKNGEFEYKSLPLDENSLSEIDATDGGQHFTSKTALDLEPLLVYYRFDSTMINAASKKALAKYISKLKGKDVVVEVKSYTDNRGSEKYNLELSKKRTASVVSILTKNGIKSEKIKTSRFGESNPVIDCSVKKCNNDDHAKNRRSSLKVKVIN